MKIKLEIEEPIVNAKKEEPVATLKFYLEANESDGDIEVGCLFPDGVRKRLVCLSTQEHVGKIFIRRYEFYGEGKENIEKFFILNGNSLDANSKNQVAFEGE